MNPTEAPRAAGADPDGSGPGPDDSRVLRAVEEYLAALEEGRPPGRDEFLARHAAVAGRLGEYLDGLELIHRAGSAAGALADPDTLADDLAGAEPLGDFLLVRELGRGGMGVVYEAVQRSLNRRVALKVLPFAATMDPRHLQRFKNEAQAAACLHHPHIVPVFGVGCERGVHYYAMQLIDGQTLAAVIAGLRRADGRPVPAEEQPTTPHVRAAAPAAETAPRAAMSTERAPLDRAHYRRVAGWGIQAAEALDQAHALGIVHRDVKPANLLVDGRDNLWVTDFGLAQVRSDARVTMTGDLVGTLRYMSPEQALAKRVVVDHRTDVYSLGATLHELLTLEPAFGGGDRQELLRQIAFEEPKAPRRVNKAIPAELETIVLKALEKNPADRYATAKELADDLRRWLADEPIRARPPGVVRRLRKWGRRHPAWVAAAAAMVLAVLLLGGVVLWRELGQRAAAEAAAGAALERAELLQQQEHWDEALAVLAVAGGQLEGRGLGALRQRVEQSRRDVDMLRKLEEAHLQRAAGSKEMVFDYAGADGLYAAAFEDYGLDVTALSPQEAAGRVRAAAIRDRLIAGLDDWASVRDKLEPESGGPQRAVAALADDDPWGRRLREAMGRRDRASLEKLAEEERALSRPSAYLELLAIALANADSSAIAERLLRQAQAGRPADFWINFELATTLGFRKKPADPAEAIRFYQAALALRPNSLAVYNNLGAALAGQGRPAEAEAVFREALRLNKDSALAHNAVGGALRDKGDVDGAIAEFRQAVRCKADHPEAHVGLGSVLYAKGDVDGATAEFREAIRYKADYPEAHNGLGTARGAKGDLDGAITEYREALRIKKDYAEAHYNLGNALEDKGDVDGAIAEWREAIRCKADHPEAHCNLGEALWGKGQLAEALTHLRRGHELGSKDPRWPYPSARWVKDCERHVELEPKLPAILSGQGRPADAAERSEYASLCQKKHLYAAAARLYREAITASPELVASPENGLRFDAAGNAALAGCGAGEDAAQLTDVERARLRQQALAWLRADLDAWRGLLDKDPAKAGPAVAQQMLRWLRETAFFNGVRGPDALAKLPEAERKEWQKLWADVAAMLARAQEKGTPAEKRVAPAEAPKKD